jgi:ABC-2 type transport system ATP-binding protein
MAEMALTADHLVVIGRGQLIADTSVAEFVARASNGRVRVSSPESPRLRLLIAADGAEVSAIEAGVDGESPSFTVSGLPRSAIGELAFRRGVVVHELTSETASLEEAFMELTGCDVEFRAQDPSQPTPAEPALGAATRKVLTP